MGRFSETVTSLWKQGMTVTNLNITKVAAFLLISFGLYILFDSYDDPKKSRDSKRILAIVTLVIGAAYLCFTLIGGLKLLTR